MVSCLDIGQAGVIPVDWIRCTHNTTHAYVNGDCSITRILERMHKGKLPYIRIDPP